MARTGGLIADVFARVERHLPDAPLVVALSGGADSATLAACVVDSGRPVRAVTVDHGLAASASLVDAATTIADKLGLPHTVVAVAPSRGEGPMRDLRLAALEDTATGSEVILTGHTADDQAETVLGNLMRGSGSAGLAGIPARRGVWVRPMLDVTRAEARQVASELGLPFVDDPDNEDPSVRRSRLRTEVIPYLESVEGDRVRSSLVRAGRLLGDDESLLSRRAEAVSVQTRGGLVRTAASSVATLPKPIASRVVRRLLRALLDPYAGSESDVDAVLAVAATGVSASVSGGLLASKEGPWIVVGPETSVPAPVVVVGRATFGWWEIVEEVVPSADFGGRWVTDIRPGAALIVRAARPGDRVDTEVGSKPVVDVLREAGVGSRFRREWPVVEADGRMAWVVGCRTATWARPPQEEKRIRLRAREAPWTSARY